MLFKRVKIIQDSHNSVANKRIKITDRHCFLEPTDIQTAEMFETRLERSKTPYVLAQVETILPEPLRYKRGYAIFVELKEEVADVTDEAISLLREEIAADLEDKMSDEEAA